MSKPLIKSFSDLLTTATGHSDGTVTIWGSMRTNFPAHRRRVIGVAFSPDGRILATGEEEGTAKLWEVATHREIATRKGHLRSVHSLGISPDSRRLATGGGDEEAVKLWDLHTHQELITLSGDRPGGAGARAVSLLDQWVTSSRCGDSAGGFACFPFESES